MKDEDGSSQKDFEKLGWKIIPADLHESFLEISLKEYASIWEELATK